MRRMITAVALGGTLLFTRPGVAGAQDPLTLTRPGPAHAILDSLAGWWSVKVTFRFGDGPEREAQASCEAKMLLGGRFLEQRYRSPSGEETNQYFGYDNQRKVFFVFKLDDRETGYLLTEGGISPDSTTITTVGTRTDPFTGSRAGMRIVTTVVDRDHFRVEWFMTQPDGRELRTVLLEHTRAER